MKIKKTDAIKFSPEYSRFSHRNDEFLGIKNYCGFVDMEFMSTDEVDFYEYMCRMAEQFPYMFIAILGGGYIKKELRKYFFERYGMEYNKTIYDLLPKLLIWTSQCDPEMSVEIIKTGANLNFQDIWGKTPLHYACENRFDELTKWLIESGAQMDITDEMGRLAYDIAEAKMCDADFDGDNEPIVMFFEKFGFNKLLKQDFLRNK